MGNINRVRKVGNKHVRILPDILFQEVGGETVLLNFNNESYFGLDAVGTRFWQLLQDETDLRNIIALMLDEYDVEAERLENDLDELIDRMVEAKLIEIRDGD